MAKCFYCDSEVIWQSDFDSYDIGYVETEEENYLVSYYQCPTCGAFYEVQCKGKDEEVDNE